ncbi:MAG: prepilin peptidase [Lachnospiraceae bacterium]|nr:prepilin peptidase [Lachnospiraceae bacterium]
MELYFEIVTYILAGLLGLCVGSFLNVVIYRTPAGMSLAAPASHCPKCRYVLKWYDNIPVISYLCLRGRCRSCKEKISFRYTAVELSNMLLWLLAVVMFWKRSIPFAYIAALASSLLICVFFIDLDHKLVFDRFVLLLGGLGMGAMFTDPHYGWCSHLIGGIAGFAFFYGIALLYTKVRGKEGLGGGDIKLTAACGLLLGWQRLLLSILLATVAASIVLVILSRRAGAKEEEGESAEYPFAPFLTSAFVIALFWGSDLITAYLSLLGV